MVYLWVKYDDGASENSAVKVPKAVYVEQVYQEGDFSGLGIPTGTSLDGGASMAGNPYPPLARATARRTSPPRPTTI